MVYIGLFFSHGRITNILDIMTKKLEKCRSRNFAIGYVNHWMNLAFKGEVSVTQVKNTMSSMLDKKFDQWKYVLLIYPPHVDRGYTYWTNFHLQRTEFHGHNVALHFLPLSHSKSCKDPEPKKWCSDFILASNPKYGFYCNKPNHVDAHKWFDWMNNHPNYYGQLSAVTAFHIKHEKYALVGDNACDKRLRVIPNPRYWTHKLIQIVTV